MSSDQPATRDRILQAAWQLLERRHGQGVRMSDIAKAAGVSRQALYLHFSSRAELLIAVTRYLDDALGLEQRLAPSRAATTGVERLDVYIAFWGGYIPKIYSVARALLTARDMDEDATIAWNDRMAAMRDGCRAAVEALARDDVLARSWSIDSATDMLWTLLSVPNWEQLTVQCGWSTDQYISSLQQLAKSVFVQERAC